jgi:uncharacterized protein YegL
MAKWCFSVCLLLGMAAARAADAVYVDNVVIVLDCSGSMQENMRGTKVRKLEAAKVALKGVLATIPQSTQVGLLVFSGKRPGWVFPLGPRQDAVFFQAVAGLSASGGTPLGEYMKIGADRLLEARQAQYGYGSYRLLLLTDGQATDGNLTTEYAPQILARGIAVDVIGVDMAEDHLLARKVNSYRRADDPQALRRAIQEVFAEVGKEDSTGGGAEDAFAELAGLPAEAATAMVTGLAAAGNEPIGSPPVAAAAAAAAPVPPSASAPPAAPSPALPSASRRPPWGALIVVAFVLMLILRAVRSQVRASRRPAPRRR